MSVGSRKGLEVALIHCCLQYTINKYNRKMHTYRSIYEFNKDGLLYT